MARVYRNLPREDNQGPTLEYNPNAQQLKVDVLMGRNATLQSQTHTVDEREKSKNLQAFATATLASPRADSDATPLIQSSNGSNTSLMGGITA